MILKLLFYLPGILAILYEIHSLRNPQVIETVVQSIKTKSKIPDKNNRGFTTNEWFFMICMLGYMIWAVVGLFSSQWILFGLLLCISFIPKVNLVIRWLDALVSLVLITFIMINAFHLHINLLEVIKSWIH